MNSRERLIKTINHQEPDRLAVDVGAGGQTGMGACAVHNLRKALFGDTVYREVRRNIEIFSPGGGFVFNTVHNIVSNVPVENILTMFRALNDARNLNSDF